MASNESRLSIKSPESSENFGSPEKKLSVIFSWVLS